MQALGPSPASSRRRPADRRSRVAREHAVAIVLGRRSSSSSGSRSCAFALTRPPQRLALLPGRRPDSVLHDRAGCSATATSRATAIGYGWPFLLAPVARARRAELPRRAAARSSLFNVLVLLPVALLAASTRIGDAARRPRSLGSRPRRSWVAVPCLAIPFFAERYHPQYVEQFLPQALGLTRRWRTSRRRSPCSSRRCSPSRALDDATTAGRACSAGLGAGFAIGVKPANALFLAGAFALALARRAALARALGARRGRARARADRARDLEGPRAREPAAVRAPATFAGGRRHRWRRSAPVERYVDWSFGQLHASSATSAASSSASALLEWLRSRGAIALGAPVARAARSSSAAGSRPIVAREGRLAASPSIDSGSFFRYVMPAFPAFFLLAASLLAARADAAARRLADTGGRRACRRAEPRSRSWRRRAAVRGRRGRDAPRDAAPRRHPRADSRPRRSRLIPVVDDLDADDQRRRPPDHAPLDPTRPDERATRFYRVFRSPTDEVNAPSGRVVHATRAAPSTARSSGRRPSATTREPVFSDGDPGAGPLDLPRRRRRRTGSTTRRRATRASSARPSR